MNFDRRYFLGASIAAVGTFVAPSSLAAPGGGLAPLRPVAEPMQAAAPKFLQQALAALDRHSHRVAHRDLIGVCDFTEHSKEERFHLVDVASGTIRKSLLVSHGKGSDPKNSGFAERFSNRPGSNASSRGSFLTSDAYVGKHGLSRRLVGLDPDNDRALERAIVIHGADYVDRHMAERQGRVGRSLGCFAFEQREIGTILELLGPGRLLFAAS